MLSCCCKCLQEQLAPLGPGHALPALPASSCCQHQHLCSCKVKWIREQIQLNTNPGKEGGSEEKKKSLFSAGCVARVGCAFSLMGHVWWEEGAAGAGAGLGLWQGWGCGRAGFWQGWLCCLRSICQAVTSC